MEAALGPRGYSYLSWRVAVAALAVTAGANGVWTAFSNALLSLLIAGVITLIADLERPRGGLIGITRQSLLDFK